MDFGRVYNVDALARDYERNFALPPLPAQLIFEESTKHPKIYLGCPVWANKNFVSQIYPRGTKSSDYLKLYSRQFNTIELNITHYRIPDEAMIQKWKNETPDEFRFCPKFYKEISHGPTLKNTDLFIREFCMRLQGLGPKLGRSFLQLPPYFSPTHIEELEYFLSALPENYEVAVEFRHPDWFYKNHLIPRATEILGRYNQMPLITDVSGRRDVLHMDFTLPEIMVRFVGNNLHASDYARVRDWIERLQALLELGLKKIYFFVHEPDEAREPELSNFFAEEWNKSSDLKIQPWISPTPEPQQVSLF